MTHYPGNHIPQTLGSTEMLFNVLEIDVGDSVAADIIEDAAKKAIIDAFNAAKSKGTSAARDWCGRMGDYIASEYGRSFFESLCGNLAEAGFDAAGSAIGIETDSKGRVIGWFFKGVRYTDWDQFQNALKADMVQRNLLQSQAPFACSIPQNYLNHQQRTTLGKEYEEAYKEYYRSHPLYLASKGEESIRPDGSRFVRIRKLGQDEITQINEDFKRHTNARFNFTLKDIELSKKYDICTAINTLMARSPSTAITKGLFGQAAAAFQFPWTYLSDEELQDIKIEKFGGPSDEFEDWVQSDEFIIGHPKSRYFQVTPAVRLTHAAAIALGLIPASNRLPAEQALENAGLADKISQVEVNTRDPQTVTGSESKTALYIGIGAVVLVGGYIAYNKFYKK